MVFLNDAFNWFLVSEIRVPRLRDFVLLLATWFASCAFVHAAPVTITFEAEVTQLVGSQATTPFDLEIGDIISGTYVFKSEDLAANAIGVPIIGSSSFDVDGVLLASTDNELHTDVAIFGLPVNYPNSTVLVDCYSTTDGFPGCNTNVVPGAGDLLWVPSLVLVGDPGLVQSSSDLLDPSVWNDLRPYRAVTIEIVESDGRALSQVLLTIWGEVSGLTVIVPEPSGLALGAAALCVGAAVYLRKMRARAA